MDMEIIKSEENLPTVPGTKSVMQQIMDADSADFIPSLRIKNPMSELPGNNGDWCLGNDLSLGQEVKVLIGPWRAHAMRFEGKNLSLEAFNRTEKAKFGKDEQGRYAWVYPDMSDAFREIIEKRKPDRGMDCRNLAGYDVLVYLPDLGKYAIYFIAGQQKNQTNIVKDCIDNPNTTFVFGTTRGKGKNHFYIPTYRKDVSADNVWPPDAEEIFTKFIETTLEVCSSGSTNPGNSVER